jgi:DNA gyrase subunit A
LAHKDKNRDISYQNQVIRQVDLREEMELAYVDYAMSVIVGRALPDVRDGLKPVHRRILYSMYENNLSYDRPYKKSATCVGDVLGSYHPHGDASVYDALVRLAQDFSMRYPLVDGRGNFGSVDGDPPAAYRYTEARMQKLTEEMMRDLEKDTVNWDPNFDESKKEPRVVPARFPNLLVNGSSGIAVGMTTNIPPHNLTEVINACICVLDNPEADLGDLLEHIKGPDFPTRGMIMGRAGIRAAYATGKGHIKVRARAEFEEFGQNRTAIIVTELPYQVNKARLVENIAEQVKEKRLDGISGLRDESDREGMRIVIEIKKDANPQVVLNRLYSQTQMQTTFAIVMLALVQDQKQPKILTLREIIDEYLTHQLEVVTRRTLFDKRKAEERAHLLRGLLIAQDNIDEVIRIIRGSYDNAQERLMERFGLDEVQSKAILEMRLRALQGLEKDKLQAEFDELQKKIAYFIELLASEEKIQGIIKEELLQIRDKFGDERKTEIATIEEDFDIEDLIEEEESIFTLTAAGYIKRLPSNTYKAQKRGGKGISAQSLREEDYVDTLFTASTHDHILFFTSSGRVYRKKGYQIPEASRTAKGTNIVNILPLEPGERVTAMIHRRDKDETGFLFMATKNGTVKRLELEAIRNIRTSGLRVLTLDEGDELISVRATDGTMNILLATHEGMAICFKEEDVRPMGRTAVGVRGIRLRSGDYVIGAVRAWPGSTLLAITENGYGKRTPIEEYIRGSGEPQQRGGYGLKAYGVSDKTGPVAVIKVAGETDDILIISDDGTIIRMAVTDVNIYGRSAQGVRVMRLSEGAKVISLSRSEAEEDEDLSTEDTEIVEEILAEETTS